MLPEVIVSADSHVAETEEWYKDIDPAFRDRIPRNVEAPGIGAAVKIDGLPFPVPLGMVCTAGRPPEKIGTPMPWDEVDPAGYSSATRLEAQDIDGIKSEVIFPSVGMILAHHPEVDYKKACFDAYNRELARYCERNPQRLVGMPQIAIRTVDEGIAELEQVRAMGFRGVMMPGNPEIEDYEHPCYDPFWEACVDLGLPINFHILTNKQDVDTTGTRKIRGPHICDHQKFIRGNQDIVSMFIFSGVFERHPGLKLVTVESDASWAPNYACRMDHAYRHHRFWEKVKLSKLPSEYLYENVYFTMQDDFPVGQMTHILPMGRILWANDFPHSDGVWPNSRAVLGELTKEMSDEHIRMITHDNVAALYGLSI